MWLSRVCHSWRSKLLVANFVIDEKPVEVWGEGGAAESDGLVGEGEDLLTVIGEIIADRERLRVRNQELQRGRHTEDRMDGLCRRMMVCFDGFERILTLGRDERQSEFMVNWLKSIEALYFRLKEMFEQEGLFEMKCLGKTVDLDFHEVVELRPSPDQPADTIIVERQKGYIYKGRVLRDAQVVVASNERN